VDLVGVSHVDLQAGVFQESLAKDSPRVGAPLELSRWEGEHLRVGVARRVGDQEHLHAAVAGSGEEAGDEQTS
jgi:hypothetical protein